MKPVKKAKSAKSQLEDKQAFGSTSTSTSRTKQQQHVPGRIPVPASGMPPRNGSSGSAFTPAVAFATGQDVTTLKIT